MAPIYSDRCTVCGHETEDIRSVSAPAPLHCGAPTERVPGVCVIAHTTRGGNLIFSRANSKWKGNKRRKVIGRGNGLGGRRKPPSFRALMQANQQTQAETMKAVDERKKAGRRGQAR